MTPGTPALRARWTLDPDVVFLNHGSFGATPVAVLAEQARLRAEMEAEPVQFLHRGLPARMMRVRERVAAFLDADPAGLVFLPNATTAVATVLASLEWRAGDEVVIADQGYNAIKLQLRRLAERYGVRPVYARVPFPIERPEQVADAFSACFSPRTRLVVLDHVTSATALIFPVEAVVARARARGIPVLVDGAHAPAFLDLSLRRVDADWYVGNLHKWLCAPKGVAVLHAREPRSVRPLVASHGWGAGLVAEFDWTGTDDPTALLSVPAAIDHLEGLGADDVRATNHDLVREGRARVAHALGVTLPHPDDPELYGAMAAIPFPPGHAEEAPELTRRLYEAHRIEVPFTTYDERVWVRISGQVYNRPEDYVRLAAALCAS